MDRTVPLAPLHVILGFCLCAAVGQCFTSLIQVQEDAFSEPLRVNLGR
jgi:hypothetical protein